MMKSGIQIGNRNYEFLTWSNSQIRDHGIWMYVSDSKGKTELKSGGGWMNSLTFTTCPCIWQGWGSVFPKEKHCVCTTDCSVSTNSTWCWRWIWTENCTVSQMASERYHQHWHLRLVHLILIENIYIHRIFADSCWQWLTSSVGGQKCENTRLIGISQIKIFYGKMWIVT